MLRKNTIFKISCHLCNITKALIPSTTATNITLPVMPYCMPMIFVLTPRLHVIIENS